MFLNELQIGERGRIIAVGGEGALRQHFLDMGVVPGSRITLVKFAPMGDPIEFRIHDYELTLRVDDARKIEIEKIEPESEDEEPVRKYTAMALHPGLGEDGKYHEKLGEHHCQRIQC